MITSTFISLNRTIEQMNKLTNRTIEQIYTFFRKFLHKYIYYEILSRDIVL